MAAVITPVAKPATPKVEAVDVTFAPGSAVISSKAAVRLDRAARVFREGNPLVMTVSGYSDPTGDPYANLLLSAARAHAVSQGLIDRGIPAKRLQMQALGASKLVDPSNPTAPQNRSVVITWR